MKLPLYILLLLSPLAWSQVNSDLLEVSIHGKKQGWYKEVMIDQFNTLVQTNALLMSEETPEGLWSEILRLTESFEPKNLASFEPPHKELQSDNRFIAKLTLKTVDGDFNSVEFDENLPPVEIQQLVELILSRIPSE